MLKQKAKLGWLKLGCGNNKYFHAFIKARHKLKSMSTQQKDYDTLLTANDDIHREVMDFYTNLMGKTDNMLDGIDINSMRDGPQLNNDHREMLIAPVSDKRLFRLLKELVI